MHIFNKKKKKCILHDISPDAYLQSQPDALGICLARFLEKGKKKKNKHSVPPIHVCICVGLEHVICSVVFMYALNRNLTSRLYNNKKKSLFMTCVHVTSFCILLKLKHISH